MFFWTDELLSKRVAEHIEAGVEVYGVWDQLGAAKEYSQDEMLCAAGARIGIENLPGRAQVRGDRRGGRRSGGYRGPVQLDEGRGL
jgi:hypothetical protein